MIEPRQRTASGLLLAVAAALVLMAAARGPAIAADPSAGDTATLAAREAELLDRYRDLERSFLRLADLLAASDPRRAAVLRSAFDRAREEQVGDRVAAIVTLLEQGQLLKAGTSQQAAIEQFRALVDLLEAGAGERQIVDTKKEVRAFLGRLGQLIARQRDIEGSTESGDGDRDLASRQRAAADEAKGLGDDIEGFARRIGEGEAGEGSPAADDEKPIEGDDEVSRARRTRQRLQAAERRMKEARERLDGAERREARREQQKAIEELETARAELEEILRQVREEEVERLLVQLETRIRSMLKAERAVLADTEKLAAADGLSGRERELEAARLGREQTTITVEATKAMTLVRDDGSAVAIPQALAQVHDDSVQAASRLARGDTRRETVGLLGEIVIGLEEMLAAVETAQQAEKAAQAGPSGGRAGASGEQPLVDKLSELKMLRALQMRVNTRTQRVARLLDDADRAEEPEWRGVLDRLAERQRAIERAARDIVGGLTE
ncbi:MAG: hypothetical protein ACR2IT_08345 [Pirellulales bacterium]